MGFLDFFRKKRNLPANHEPPNFKVLAKNTNFTKNEIIVIYERYLSLCNYETGLLEKIPFVQQPELALNPIIDLAYDMECRNFLSLRLLRKKEKEDKLRMDLERRRNQREKKKEEREDTSPLRQEDDSHKHSHKKNKKHRHKKNKNKKLNLDSESNNESLESLGGSLESYESIDESLDSIECEHVHSIDLSAEPSAEELLEAASEGKSDTNNEDYDKNNNRDIIEETEKNEGKEEHELLESGTEEKSDMNNEDYDKNNNQDINEEAEKNEEREDNEEEEEPNNDENKSTILSGGNVDANDTTLTRNNSVDLDKKAKNDAQVDNSGAPDEKNIDNKTDDHSTYNEADASLNATEKVNVEKHMEKKEKRQKNRKDKVEEKNKLEIEVDVDSDEPPPPLMPMTSSFFRAQERLRQLETKKRLAGIPPEGIDFTHFILILNEFSPKATTSSKTSYFFKIIAANNTGCISKEEYLDYLKRITYGLVPPFLYDLYIDEMWNNVCSKLEDGDREITRKMFSNFISAIDVDLFMTIPF